MIISNELGLVILAAIVLVTAVPAVAWILSDRVWARRAYGFSVATLVVAHALLWVSVSIGASWGVGPAPFPWRRWLESLFWSGRPPNLLGAVTLLVLFAPLLRRLRQKLYPAPA